MKFAVRLLLLAAVLAPVANAAPLHLDRAGSEIAFRVTQMGVGVDGRFTRFDAAVDLDPARIEDAAVSVTVDVASLTTGNEDADTIAVDRPWLNAAVFPQARFSSTEIRALGDARYEATGELRIRDRTRAIVVPFTLQAQPDGALLARGELRLRRSDFGIGGGEWNEGDLVANEVPVNVRLRLLPRR